MFPLVFGFHLLAVAPLFAVFLPSLWNPLGSLANFLFGLLFSVLACFPWLCLAMVFWPQMCSPCVRSPTGCRFFVRCVSAVFLEFLEIPGKLSVRASLLCSGVFPMALPRLVFWPHIVPHCFPHFPPDFRSVFGLCPPLASWLAPLAFCLVFFRSRALLPVVWAQPRTQGKRP